MSYANYACLHRVLDLAPVMKSEGRLAAPDFLVIISLARHTNKAGQSYPSQKLISDETFLSQRTVWASIRKLVSIGYLHVEAKRGRANSYVLCLPNDKGDSSGQEQTVHADPTPAPQTATPVGQSLAEAFWGYQGKPVKWEQSLQSWAANFDKILTQYSQPELAACLNWAFELDSFWPKHLVRSDKDPLVFFASKVDDLMARHRGYLKALKNHSTSQKSSLSKAVAQSPDGSGMEFRSAV
jgi:biotin operon repressor